MPAPYSSETSGFSVRCEFPESGLQGFGSWTCTCAVSHLWLSCCSTVASTQVPLSHCSSQLTWRGWKITVFLSWSFSCLPSPVEASLSSLDCHGVGVSLKLGSARAKECSWHLQLQTDPGAKVRSPRQPWRMAAQTLQCPAAAATFKRYLCFVKHHGWRVSVCGNTGLSS